MDDIEKKRTYVTDKLSKRDDERIAEAQQRKTARDATTASNETSEYFTTNFSKSKSEIESGIEQSKTVPKSELTAHLDTLTVKVQNLQKFVADSTVFLTSREVRNSQNIVTELQSAIQTKRDELMPKKKFAFKSKRKEAANEKSVSSLTSVKKSITVDIAECNFSSKENEDLTMQPDEINSKDIALSSLKNCNVKLHGTPSAIHIDKLENCKVLCGPVSGSIFIDNCVDCVFVLPCQQLRIHNTTKTKFYIHVTSKAIIEDCNNVEFGPYAWTYPEIDTHYTASGLDRSINNWSDVDDFNWLASDKKSPNWRVIADQDREQF